MLEKEDIVPEYAQYRLHTFLSILHVGKHVLVAGPGVIQLFFAGSGQIFVLIELDLVFPLVKKRV